jgi:hypothetical protein
MHARFESARPHDVLTLAAATWLACGVVLFGLTPLPWRDATLGWTPAFWLLAAPCVLLAARRLFPARAEAAPRRAVRLPHGTNVQAPRRRKINARSGNPTRQKAA